MTLDAFQGREIGLRTQIARAVAARDGLDFDGSSRFRYECESIADTMIAAWRRNPDIEPASDIERLCRAVVDNDRALQAYRQNLAEQRAAMNPKPDLKQAPKTATFTARDPSGSVVLVTCHDNGNLTWAWAS
jgi:hypothetical protein